MNELGSHTSRKLDLDKRRLLTGLAGLGLAAITPPFFPQRLYAAPALTPNREQSSPEVYDLNELIADGPITLNSLHFTDAASQGVRARVYSDTLPFNYSNLSIATADSYDANVTDPKYYGMTVIESAETHEKTGWMHSSYLGNTPLPAEGLRAIEGDIRQGFLGPIQLQKKILDTVQSQGISTWEVGNGKERFMPIDIRAFYPSKNEKNAYMRPQLVNHLFRSGIPYDMNVAFCATSGPESVRELIEICSPVDIKDVQDAVSVLTDPMAQPQDIRSAVVGTLYPYLHEEPEVFGVNANFAPYTLAKYTGATKKTIDPKEHLHYPTPQELETSFNLRFYAYGTWVWKLRHLDYV